MTCDNFYDTMYVYMFREMIGQGYICFRCNDIQIINCVRAANQNCNQSQVFSNSVELECSHMLSSETRQGEDSSMTSFKTFLTNSLLEPIANDFYKIKKEVTK